jgi:hypothetical protein
VWGNATISGNTVVVSSPTVPSPTRVRYAWGDNPVFSLYNKEGLPAMPFTTESPELVPPVTGGMAGSGGTAGSDGGTAGAAGSGGMGGVASGEGGKVGGEGGSAGGIANNVAGAGLVGAGTAGATSGVGGLTGAPAAAGSDDAGCACTTVQPRSRSTRALSLVLLALVTGLSRRSRGSSAPRSNASGDRSPSRGHGSDTL